MVSSGTLTRHTLSTAATILGCRKFARRQTACYCQSGMLSAVFVFNSAFLVLEILHQYRQLACCSIRHIESVATLSSIRTAQNFGLQAAFEGLMLKVFRRHKQQRPRGHQVLTLTGNGLVILLSMSMGHLSQMLEMIDALSEFVPLPKTMRYSPNIRPPSVLFLS